MYTCLVLSTCPLVLNRRFTTIKNPDVLCGFLKKAKGSAFLIFDVLSPDRGISRCFGHFVYPRRNRGCVRGNRADRVEICG